MGRLRSLKIYIKIYAIAALGLAYFPESVAVLMTASHAHRPGGAAAPPAPRAGLRFSSQSIS
jgi:hypothetical protein